MTLGLSGSVLAVPVTVSDSMTFATVDQGMWGPATATGAPKPVDKSFTLPVVKLDTGPQSIGDIVEASKSFPNPLYLAWKTAWDACRKLFSSTTCRNGADIPFVGHVGGLGSAPARTITVSLGKNGLKLHSDIAIEAGFKGAMTFDSGKVDVTYPTLVSLQADKDTYSAGEVMRLSLTEAAGTPTMSTEFSDLDMSLKAYADLDVSAGVEAYVAGIGGGSPTNIVNWDTYTERELVGVGIGGNVSGDKDVEIRVLGASVGIDTSGGLGTNIPISIDYPPETTSPIRIPLADVQVQVPELDTPPSSNWDATENTLTNTQYPIERDVDPGDLTLIGGGTGFHPTDVLKADLDIDGLISAGVFSSTGVPAIFGLTGGVTGVLSLEGNLVDFDMGAFFGFGQTMEFTPTLMTELAFSMPVMVLNDAGVYEEVTAWTMAVGDQLDMIFPDGDLIVSPTYYLDGVFSNLTEFLISPVASLAILQLKLSGLAAEIAGISTDLALLQHVFPLGDPISAATIYDGSYALGGFDPFAGTSLSLALATGPAAVPAPPMWLLLFSGLIAMSRVWVRRALNGSSGAAPDTTPA